MITLSLNFGGNSSGATRGTQEKQIREIVGTHLAFPGSDKLKMDVTVNDNGSSAVSFTGPKDLIAEAKRLWAEKVKPQAKKLKKAVARATKPVTKATKKPAKAAAPKRKPVHVKAKVKTKASKVARGAKKKR